MMFADPSAGGASSRRMAVALFCRVVAGSLASGFISVASGANLVVNWGFSNGLSSWETEGSVAATAGLAVLSDDAATESVLFQVVATEAGVHEFRFDFWNLTSDKIPEGTVPDIALAALYLVDDPAAFDPLAGTGFADSIDLMDGDAAGESVLVEGGGVTPAPVDDRFLSFSLAFDNPLGLAVAIVFTLLDHNFLLGDDDSKWVVDNVVLTRPEAVITVRDEDDYFVVEAGAVLEVSTTLAVDGWVEVGRSEYPVVVVPARRDGRATQVQVDGNGSEPVRLSEEVLLPGFRRVDFRGGRLQVKGVGLEGWAEIPATPGPVIVADPDADRLFYRSALPR